MILNKKYNMNVLHGPVNIANQPWVLSRYERQLGLRSDLVVNYNTWLNYQVDRCLSPIGKKNAVNVKDRLLFGLTAPLRYQILHYYFGRSFLCWDDYGLQNKWWYFDLKLAKWLRRKVFMTLQGCDARLALASNSRNIYTPCRENFCSFYTNCLATLDDNRKKNIELFHRYADQVFILNPELAKYVPGAVFLPYASVDVESLKPYPPSEHATLRILHAPSDPKVKGTEYILKAVAALKTKYPIELLLVQNLSHSKAMELYQTADLVIDQLLCGWYGGFAVEVMAMAKPVAAYIRDEDLDTIPAEMRQELPIIRVTIDSLVDDLEKAIRAREAWPEWGARSRQFALKWHNPATIALAMAMAYRRKDSRFNLLGAMEERQRTHD
jgi:hypothetical protein